MLYKITTKSDITNIKNKFPKEVIAETERVADILDTNYNSKGTDGGYILIAEDIADSHTVKEKYIDYTDMIYEFKDNISDDRISALYLTGTEYSVTLICNQSDM